MNHYLIKIWYNERLGGPAPHGRIIRSIRHEEAKGTKEGILEYIKGLPDVVAYEIYQSTGAPSYLVKAA